MTDLLATLKAALLFAEGSRTEYVNREEDGEVVEQVTRDELLAALTAQIEAVEKEGWQPAATIPKGELVDIIIDGKTRWCDCYYDQICDQWRTSRPSGHLVYVPAKAVTHWRFPPPPAVSP